uniref:NACHT, LRR and PYD domains-containing protein 12-like n=1 Tax=Cyprinus carpio carpio TaxID=630221 RepID=A0A8C1HKV8_CYPCA
MSVLPQLLETLEDLESKKLKKFKWHLKHDSLASTADVEKADVFDTVDHMVARCGPEGAMEITLNILRKMNENHLAECLENKLKDQQKCPETTKRHHEKQVDKAPGQIDSSTETGVSVDVKAETGATVNAHLLTGNTFTGQVNFYNSAATGKGSVTVDSKAALHDYTEKLKNKLKQDCERILVGNSQTGHQKYLNDIYTDLYVVQNETGGRVNDHEVRQIELNLKQSNCKDTPIECSNIFKVNMGRRNRKVLTMGIAGVGKTVSVSKFILDWAEGKENQDISLIFPLPFRELNLITQKLSLMELLHKFCFSSSEQLPSLPEGDGEVMFIFDGLDECRFPLSFKKNDSITSVHEKTTLSNMITSLIKTHLVPSALIWITSRPAAASLIPRDYINQVTEVRGFNDEQKEKYFNKNSSAEVAGIIIRHIRKIRSLYIMCHIPVFCWISLNVLQPLLDQKGNDKMPTTLTGMYINFLISQQQKMVEKYCDDPESKDNAMSFDKIILKLGELAFKQLEKGHLIFYKEDLEECGLDVSDGSVFSGLCTQIFHKAVSTRNVYSFVHLSIQEFLAGLYVFLIYKDEKANPFLQSRKEKVAWKFSKKPLFHLHKAAINKALQSKNGHLDLFLRFLLGLSLESNQRDLTELLPKLKLKTEKIKYTAEYIRKKIEEENSVERTINLFYCLSELKDDYVEEIQKNFRTGNLSVENLSSAQWSALVFVLLISEETQEIFELQKYGRSDETLMRLLPVIKNTKRALLRNCMLTSQSCESLSSSLQSSNSALRELDLSCNELQDSGVELLSDGLKSPNCQLEILRLPICSLTAQCCKSLSSALLSSVIGELDLSNNDLQDSGVKLLSDGLKSLHCQLKILRLSGCMVTEEGCGYVSSALSSNPSHLRELDLSYNHPGDSGVKLLSEKLDDPNCSLDKLNVDHGGEFRITAGLHKYACNLTLDPNTANNHIILSEENKKVTYAEEEQSYPDYAERFDRAPQVLCRESLSGRCYWEVDWSGKAHISVAYKRISRKGSRDCMFGLNRNSWSLICIDDKFLASHNNQSLNISVSSHSCKRVGVYVDVSAGTLSFYSISDTNKLTHLHTFNTTFTEPLCAGFRLIVYNSSVSLCQTKKPVSSNRDNTHTLV